MKIQVKICDGENETKLGKHEKKQGKTWKENWEKTILELGKTFDWGKTTLNKGKTIQPFNNTANEGKLQRQPTVFSI